MGRRPASKTESAREADQAASPLLRLINAAEDIFLAKGFHTATMSDVAQAAGMSKKTVYMLIKSKAELFGLLLEHHQSLLKFPETQPDWAVRDILFENLMCLSRFLISPEQIAVLRLIMAEYSQNPALARLFHKHRVSKAQLKLQSVLKDVSATCGGTAKDSAELSAMLFGMALGEFHLSVLMGYRALPGKAALEARVRRAVDIFLAGCERR